MSPLAILALITTTLILMLALPASTSAGFAPVQVAAQLVNQVITIITLPVLLVMQQPVLPPAAAHQLLSHVLVDIICLDRPA